MKDFAGTEADHDVHSLMSKSAFITAAVFFGFVSIVAAQQAQLSAQIQAPLLALNQRVGILDPLQGQPNLFKIPSATYQGYPRLALSDGRSFAWPNFAWVEPSAPEFLPPVKLASPVPSKTKRLAVSSQSSDTKVVEVKSRLFDYADGEAGVLYGKSFGKYSGSVEQGYIFGEVGNDNIHISAGASYQDSTVRYPRFGR